MRYDYSVRKNMNFGRSKSLIYLLLIITSCFVISNFYAFAEGSIAIIAHNDVSDRVLEKSEVESIFLGKKSKWSSKDKIKVFTLKRGDVHKDFLKLFVGKTSAQFKSYWKRQVFTGKGKPPKSFKTEQEILDNVSRTPGAIGYVSKSFLQANSGLVKEIDV